MRQRGGSGQAAVELLAMVPVIVLAGLLGWQLMAAIGAGLAAQEEVRDRALHAEGAGRPVVVSATAPVPVVIPGVTGLRVVARAGIRTP